MYRELEKPANDAGKPTEAAVPCDCICGEPVPESDDDAPVGNKSAVILEVYWDLNG